MNKTLIHKETGRIVDRSDTEFEVHPAFEWIDTSTQDKDIGATYNKDTREIIARPEPVERVDPIDARLKALEQSKDREVLGATPQTNDTNVFFIATTLILIFVVIILLLRKK